MAVKEDPAMTTGVRAEDAGSRTTAAGSRRWHVVMTAGVVVALVVAGLVADATRHHAQARPVALDVPYSKLPYPDGRTPDGRYVTLVDTNTYMVTSQPFGTKPSPAQSRAADRFYDATMAAIAKYRDVRVAVADGYRQVVGDANHYVKPAYLDDGRVADPSHIESLVYDSTPSGKILVGAMYLAPGVDHGLETGGPATAWHYHVYQPPFCIVASGFPVGRPDAHGHCRLGVAANRSPEMLHVWIWNPRGRFDSDVFDPDPAQIAAHFARH